MTSWALGKSKSRALKLRSLYWIGISGRDITAVVRVTMEKGLSATRSLPRHYSTSSPRSMPPSTQTMISAMLKAMNSPKSPVYRYKKQTNTSASFQKNRKSRNMLHYICISALHFDKFTGTTLVCFMFKIWFTNCSKFKY